MFPDARVTVYDAFAQNVLCLDATTSGDLGMDSLQYEDTPTGCGAGTLTLDLTYSEITARGYWRGFNIVEISTADNVLQQAVTTNLAPNSDTLAGWTLAGPCALGTSGPGGATDVEVIGTGVNITSNVYAVSSAISVIAGATYTLSWFVDPSQITHGDPDFQIVDASTNSVIHDVNAGVVAGGAAKRYSDSFTIPSGTTAIKLQLLCWNGQSGGFIVANGQKLKFSQPMLEQKSTASAWYVPSGTSTRLYLDSKATFDPSEGEDGQQAYLWDGATLTMLIPVSAVGTDGASGQPYITVSAPIAAPGNPLTIGNYGVGTYVGRRRYCGRILRRTRPNTRQPKANVSLIGLAKTMSAYSTFTIGSQDAGTAVYNTLAQFSSRWPFLTISQANFPTIGWQYNGQQTNYSALQMISDILASVPTGDLWVMRIGHDRTPRLVKVYTSASNSYTYPVTLPQGVTNFEPLNVQVNDEDASSLYNAVQVTASSTLSSASSNAQPSIIIDDSTSISSFGQVDAQPVMQTGLSTQTDCQNFGTALLNQFSLPSASNQFRVYCRNDNAPTNMPAGFANGDVVRGINAVTLTRFDDTGTVRNLVPDSEFIYGPGQTDAFTWNVGASTAFSVGLGAGPAGLNELQLAGTGVAQTDIVYSLPIDVAPGQTLTLSAWINASASTSGSPRVAVFGYSNGALTSTLVGYVSQPFGNSGSVSATFQIPSNFPYAQVAVVCQGKSVVTPTGHSVAFAQLQLEPGSFESSYVMNSAAPSIFGLVASVKTTIDPRGDRWQDVKFAAIEPDWNAAMSEKARAIANAVLLNTPTPVSIASYCVSSDAYPGGGLTISGLTVDIPAFLAIFALGTAVQSITAAAITLEPIATNWVWLNPNDTWTVNQTPATVQGSILFGYFQTSATGVLGWTPRASVGVVKIGVGNINVAANLPAPTVSGVSVLNTSTPTSLASDVSAALTVTNVPQNGSAYALAYYYRHTGTTSWVPYGEVTLPGLPSPSASTTMPTFVYGQLQNGIAYDYAVGFAGLAGYGPLTTVASNVTATPIVITTPYMIGTTSPTPTITGVTVTNGISANGLTAAIDLVFTLTNQPTDGSLSRISVWYRKHSDPNWTFYVSIGVPGLPTPPASQAYNITLADISNGQSYDFGVTYENAQGEDSATVGVIYSNWAAQAINLPTSALPSVPTGTTMTATGSVTGYISAGAAGFDAEFTVTPSITSSLPFSAWGVGFVILRKVNNTGSLDGDTNPNNYAPCDQIPTSTWTSGALTGTTSTLAAGNSYQLAIAAVAQNGSRGPIVPFAIAVNQPITPPTLPSPPGNLVVDSGFKAANFNSSGYASSDPNWQFEWIDGSSFMIAEQGVAPGGASWPANMLRVTSGDNGRFCQALSDTINVNPGQTYYFSAYFSGGYSSGTMPYVAIVATNWNMGSATGTIYQQLSPVAPINAQTVSGSWVCPTGVTQVCVLFNSNKNTVGGGDSLYMGAPYFSITQGSYQPGSMVKHAIAVSPPTLDANSSPAGGAANTTDTPGTHVHGMMSGAVQAAIDSSSNVLNVEFGGAKYTPSGTLTSVDGQTLNQTIQTASGSVTVIKGQITGASSTGNSTRGFYIGGNLTSNFYGFIWDTGALRITASKSGTGSVLASAASSPAYDTNTHSIECAIWWNASAGTNYLEVTVDGTHTVTYSDSTSPLAPSSVNVMALTGGSAGSLAQFQIKNSGTTHGNMPAAYRTNFDGSGNALKSSMFKTDIPNSLGNLLANFKVNTYSAASGSLVMWFTSIAASSSPGGSQYPGWTYPDGSGAIYPGHSNGYAAVCGTSSSSPRFTWTSLGSGGTYIGVVYNVLADNFTVTYGPTSTPPTDAQVAAAIGDGQIAAVIATATTASVVPTGGGGGYNPNPGGPNHVRY